MSLIDAWIPYTKLHPPRLRSDVVPRERVTNLLRGSIQTKRLTLVSAPAGYGKTTLAVNWLAQIADTPQSPDVAWLSLDEGDDDPIVFMAGLVAALKQVDAAYGASIEVGQTAPNLNLRRQMGLLINDIGAAINNLVILVLDDLHTITNLEIHQALDYLIRHLPSQMRIIIITRVDPPLSLARFRARGELAEIRPPDLRFTIAEAEALLNGTFALDLRETELQTLHTSVEGWVAALHLLATSLPPVETPGREDRIGCLAKVKPQLFDLLAEEVLEQQPPAIRDFLLITSILDELTAELCIVVTEVPTAPQLLAEVYRRNLFLIAKDDATETTYRYHDLFAQFLRFRLTQTKPTQVQALHLRAGDAEPNAARAIRHYLAAKAYEQAAERIEQVAEQLFTQGLFARLQGWVVALPEVVRNGHPWLNFFMGMAQWGQSRHRQAQRYLEQALAEFEAQNDEQGCGETMVQLSIVHQTQGDFAPAIQYINTALSQQISARSRCQSHLALAWLALAQSQVDLAATHLNTAYSLAEASQDEGAINICMMQTRFPFQCVPSGYKLFPRLTTLLERQQPAPMSPRRAAIFGAQMFVHFLAGNVAQAIVAGEQARHISQQLGGLSWLMMDTGAMLAILYSIRGDQYRFDELVQENERLTERFTGWRRTSLYLYGYCYWSHNWLDKMEAMFAQMQAALPNEWPSANVC